MADLFINRISKPRQYIFSVLVVVAVSLICYALSAYIGYRIVAFILLLTVSLIAMIFDILPVLFTAVLTALIWDFFFIPPRFTLFVGTTEDLIFLLMYFMVAMINAVLTYKIRQIEKVARQKEEKANTVKLYDTLLNSLSHELRTPIATIIGATDNLQNNSAKLTPLNRHELIAEIAKASFRLNEQVENLLNMSRLESGFLEPKNDWCDINELVYSVVKNIESNKITQAIHININPDIPFFKLDKGMLEQVLYNLLNNATQHTPASSRIDIMAINYADVLQIVIEDNGPGFPRKEIEQVFNKFYRLNGAHTGGTGLGLSIVKGFTEAMGGTVKLENRQDSGARFTIDIPAKTSFIKNLKNE
jgi:two-component system, OmpR family, sensor histidine kinase KdpD